MPTEPQTIIHITQNGKYHISVERGAVKGTLGYKVSVNSDNFFECVAEVTNLKLAVEKIAVEPVQAEVK